MTDLEMAGRYLCKIYYSGKLPPSEHTRNAVRSLRCAEYFLARCVETVLEDSMGRSGSLAAIWRQLMSGDLAKLNTARRQGLLGGRALRDAERASRGKEERLLWSIDGAEAFVREKELMLYSRVGLEFKKLITKS